MPIYEYRCAEGHSFEALQSMSDDPLATCELCGAPVERVLHPVAVHFKGSGFYSTDYAGKGKKDEGGKEGGSSDSGGDSDKSDKSESKSNGSKSDSSGSSGESKTKAGSGSD